MTTAGSVPGVRSSNFTNLFDAQIRSVSTNADSRLAQESPDPKNRIADPKNRIGGGARPGGSPLVGFAYKGQRRTFHLGHLSVGFRRRLRRGWLPPGCVVSL